MVKNKKKQSKQSKHKKSASAASGTTPSATATNQNVNNTNSNNNNNTNNTASNRNRHQEVLDTLDWLRYCDTNQDNHGQALLQLEYQPDDPLMLLLNEFLISSRATVDIIDTMYQIWQQTVVSTLLASSSLWKQPIVQSSEQKLLKELLKTARYKIHFLLHHVIGSILTSKDQKWQQHQSHLLDLCYQSLSLLPRLAESCPPHKTDIRQAIFHLEGKEFLAAVACETWDTLYDTGVSIDPQRFIPILRRCAMLDILDKDWNMLGGWEDILQGLEAKCCNHQPIQRLPCDAILHDQTTILRNARNSMQCKFFSVRFMKYTLDQAPQRWKYFPKCSAPACAHIETRQSPHQLRCTKCWYFHYCSPTCQDYCESIMGLHPKFCVDTPLSKAKLCQQETENYLGWNQQPQPSSKNGTGTQELHCHACGMAESLVLESSSSSSSSTGKTPSTSAMKQCSQCQKVVYCSRQCQEWDWRIGGHKQSCQKNQTNSTHKQDESQSQDTQPQTSDGTETEDLN